MKKILCLVLSLFIVLLSLTFAACSSGGYEGEVNVYNWGEYISNGDDDSIDVIAEFEKKYNIKVNYTNFETNEELYNILKNSNSQYDVIIPSDYMIEKLSKEGMLSEIDYDNIPNYKYIMDKFKGMNYDPENKYTVPYTWGVTALCYNTTMVDSEDVDSFEVLWNEKYAGKVLMFNNSKDAYAIAMKLCDPEIDPGAESFSFEDIDRATEKLVAQKPNVKKYVMDQVFTEMENNQAAIAPYYAGDVYTMMSNNEDLDYALAKEGANWFVDCMCIPANCQNKEYAELFIDFMCDPEIGAANAEYIGYSTPNYASFELLDDEMKNCELIYPSDEYLDKCYTYANIPSDVYNYMQEKFIKACSSTAEVDETEDDEQGASPLAVAVVCIIIAAAVISIIVFSILDIRKAYMNRNKINKE